MTSPADVSGGPLAAPSGMSINETTTETTDRDELDMPFTKWEWVQGFGWVERAA